MNILRSSLLITTMLVGCTTVVDYPPTWPPLTTEAGCESITGTYLNRGNAADGQSTYLSDWLFEANSKANLRIRNFQYLALAFDQHKQINISGINGPESTPAQLSKIEKYECKSGSLSFNLSAVKSGDNVVSIGSSKRRLYKSANYLVVESTESGVAIVLLIPVVASANNWARFPIVDRKQ